ncbi:hypothetical protein OKJ48_38135 [Streptomyces kunmingensis]|uniref:Serine/threonine protein kinase n=1 Tax=Streptomyces kunmingensis TaxID=68225 RepID=A0ABU6CPJ4_9ACTN|nr:hypothetical protein [Streptomyces kunmingensis]MEB3966002.1 hypothetical protein [Streptomyces kunmingensis]
MSDEPGRQSASKTSAPKTSAPKTSASKKSASKTEAAPAGTAEKGDDRTDGAASVPADGTADEKSGAAADRPSSSLLTGLGLAAAAQCGPQLTSPEGIEAQTCVLRQERDTWARTYYRNTTGGGLSAVLTLMAPGGRTVQITCVVGAEDEPGMCETPRGRTRAEPARYAAVAEYAAHGDGPLLLRSGSNSAPAYGR